MERAKAKRLTIRCTWAGSAVLGTTKSSRLPAGDAVVILLPRTRNKENIVESIQDGINKDKERNSKLLKTMSYQTEFTPEDIRQALNAVCFDPSTQNLTAIRALSDQIYRQQWYYKNVGTN